MLANFYVAATSDHLLSLSFYLHNYLSLSLFNIVDFHILEPLLVVLSVLICTLKTWSYEILTLLHPAPPLVKTFFAEEWFFECKSLGLQIISFHGIPVKCKATPFSPLYHLYISDYQFWVTTGNQTLYDLLL